MTTRAIWPFRRRLGVLVLVLGAVALSYVGISSNAVKTNAPDGTPQNHEESLPPLSGGTFSEIEKWFSDTGRPWRKQKMDIAERKVVCVDFRPYSGQPGHHLFVYQITKNGAFLCFYAKIFNPPNPTVYLSYEYDKANDSLVVKTSDMVCLSVRMTTLLSD